MAMENVTCRRRVFLEASHDLSSNFSQSVPPTMPVFVHTMQEMAGASIS